MSDVDTRRRSRDGGRLQRLLRACSDW